MYTYFLIGIHIDFDANVHIMLLISITVILILHACVVCVYIYTNTCVDMLVCMYPHQLVNACISEGGMSKLLLLKVEKASGMYGDIPGSALILESTA